MPRSTTIVRAFATPFATLSCLIVVQLASAVEWEQQAKLRAGDGAAYDEFGFSVSISGNTAIVGAYKDDDNATDCGSVYIFHDSGSGWAQCAKLVPDDGAEKDSFGRSVAISGDTAIVGAMDHTANGTADGAAYIYERQDGEWAEVAKLLAADDYHVQFGFSVSIDGDTAIIGAWKDRQNGRFAGSAYIFQDSGSGWAQVAKLLPSDGEPCDEFGETVCISGNTAIVGAPRHASQGRKAGAAYVFQDSPAGWRQTAKLLPADVDSGDHFGISVSISENAAIVGACYGEVYGAEAGVAYLFRNSSSGWKQIAKLLPGDNENLSLFGSSVSISGNTAVVGAWGDNENGTLSGSAFVFQDSGENWMQVAKLLPTDGEARDRFGSSVSLSSGIAVAGAYQDDDDGVDSGSAYVFAIPEPGTLSLLIAGGLCLLTAGVCRRGKRAA